MSSANKPTTQQATAADSTSNKEDIDILEDDEFEEFEEEGL